jgi:colanic acid/amylovoran biosynthesis protein
LPQTYGPSNSLLSKRIARFLLSRAAAVYSRDKASIDDVQELLCKARSNGNVLFCPDLAFVLEPSKPEVIDVGPLLSVKTSESITVGMNISGLLYNGGYTHNNMFALKADYKQAVHTIIDELMQNDRVLLLLVPHVIGPDQNLESDKAACSKVYEHVIDKYPNRIFLARGTYDQSEVKYVISLCDFFIGSRMHACIAALSQSIPAVGLAYSKKFQGVFETVGARDLVVDMRHAETEKILSTITDAFEHREITAQHLRTIVPQVQRQVLTIFEGIV